MSEIDHIASVDDNIATQYRESAGLISYLKTAIAEANNLEAVFCELLEDRFLETAENFTLDIIGSIVGQPRGFIPGDALPQFAFRNDAGDSPVFSDGFGSHSDPNVGAIWASATPSTSDPVVISDALYRTFIKARIAKNNTTVTPEDVISQAIFVTGVSSVEYEELGDAEYNLTFAADLSEEGKVLISFTDLLPKPVGVKANYLEA